MGVTEGHQQKGVIHKDRTPELVGVIDDTCTRRSYTRSGPLNSGVIEGHLHKAVIHKVMTPKKWGHRRTPAQGGHTEGQDT